MTNKNTPKISINKLGEFLTANSTRQRKILETFKNPDENRFTYTYYSDARKAINAYLQSNFNAEIILKCLDYLRNKGINNDFLENEKRNSIEALEFVLNTNAINKNLIYSALDIHKKNIIIEGVDVSVNPDIIIRKVNNKGINKFGIGKVHISQSTELPEDTSKYISAILYMYAIENIVFDNEQLDNKLCISYDVFRDFTSICPNSIIRITNDIKSGCKNIRAIWDSI
ncbi:hypothetical protein [Chondrinema litorale]|uniref:hypothetical protein n=1 Tax=Chondrinema litorale TaxID=2994555 RepID=UPI0025433131|nr:hypothetical protein [Chondrinema litorale]UZR95306.1 hypothetical protein OQ292_05665 [Chondrinema litorale]